MFIKIRSLLIGLRDNVRGMQTAEAIALAGLGIAVVVALTLLVRGQGEQVINDGFTDLNGAIDGAQTQGSFELPAPEDGE